MATIEGVYLADDRDNLIFEYPTSASSPSLKTVLSTLRGSSTSSTHSNESIVDVSRSHTVYRSTKGRVVAYAFIRHHDHEQSLHLKTIGDDEDEEEANEYEQFDDSSGLDASVAAQKSTKTQEQTASPCPLNPTLVFVFLHQLLATLLDYFGTPLNPVKIEANYDVMCNLMQELIQGGAPYITDLNSLRELVPFKSSLGASLLSTTNQLAKSYVSGGASFNSLTSTSSGFSSSDLAQERVPWRRPHVKYTNNEIFVDLTETINVVMSPHQTLHKLKSKNGGVQKQTISTNRLFTTVAVLEGQVDFTSHLSGIPEVLLNLNTAGHSLGLPSFHRCIKVDKWANKEGTLSFIPPDGKSTLMKYTVDLDRVPTQRAQRSLGVVMPEYKQGLGSKGNEFEVVMSISLQKGISKIERMSVVIATEASQSIKILRLSHGDFQTGKQGKGEWIFEPGQKLGVTAVLRGIVEDSLDPEPIDDKAPVPVHMPKQISLSYQLKGGLPSGIKVDSLKIVRGMGDVVPYKGVKYITRTGDFMIR